MANTAHARSLLGGQRVADETASRREMEILKTGFEEGA